MKIDNTPPIGPATARLYRVVRSYFDRADGVTFDMGETRVHVSRHCDNCAHDGAQDADWISYGSLERYGRCMNWCTSADAADQRHQWCTEHQTHAEYAADKHRPGTPLLTVLETPSN